ncbi:MAG: sigma-70 family RNA polymerase sigma factor [Patescibacteria group bacterium]|jgi:RNA polymerase sigma-70 factor (ECF subfamily)
MADFDSLTDEELVEHVRSKDQEVYSELVKRYEARLLRYAHSFVHDNHAAQDVVQNAFIKAFINLNGFNTKKKFSSWIYRIVHNESLNEIKKYKKEFSLDSMLESSLPISDDSMEDAFDTQISKEKISTCIDKLPFTYRSPIILHFLEDKSYEEISDILRMPIGTVGTRINRGKKLLNQLCNDHG